MDVGGADGVERRNDSCLEARHLGERGDVASIRIRIRTTLQSRSFDSEGRKSLVRKLAMPRRQQFHDTK
jgi:hypothetical protein